MKQGRLECWKCGESLADLPLPLGRADTCRRCNADLHVCNLCTFFDPSVANACREPIAEHVGNKERANFCGYFTPRHDAWAGSAGDRGPSRAALDALFGLGGTAAGAPTGDTADTARQDLDDLFDLNKKSDQ